MPPQDNGVRVKVRSGYKQTEVGVIPEDWETPDLASITDPNRPISYGIVQTGPNVAGGVRCLRVLDINAGRINRADLITTSERISASYKRTILVANDLVMPLRGKVGDVGIIDKDLVGCNLTRGVALIAIRPQSSPSYCKQAISSSASRSRLEQSMNGSALQEIPIGILRRFKLVLPSTLAEQEAIAAALSDADALIESLEQLLTKKRQIKKSAMQELLTGKKRLPGFSGKWEVKRLGDESDLITKGTTPTSLGRNFTKHGINFVKVESLTEDGGFLPEMLGAVDEETHHLLKRSQLRKNDILFSIAGALGRTAIVSTALLPANTNQALAIIRLKSQSCLRHSFILKYLSGPQIVAHINAINVQAAQANLSLVDIRSFGVPAPSATEQTAIATILSDMDEEIAALEAKLSKAHKIKQGMMQELLTGRIRLL